MNQPSVSVRPMIELRPNRTYQVAGGRRLTIISATEDDATFDYVLVLQPEDGVEQVIMMATEFVGLTPEPIVPVTIH